MAMRYVETDTRSVRIAQLAQVSCRATLSKTRLEVVGQQCGLLSV
jgi:hypothetical protein